MQDKIRINGIEIWQPDAGQLAYNFETTYTEDSTRVQSGVIHLTPMFTVESFGYAASNIPIFKMREILVNIARGNPFTLHCFSPFYGAWRDDKFYVGKGSLNIGRLKEEEEVYDSLSFNMIGVNPI